MQATSSTPCSPDTLLHDNTVSKVSGRQGFSACFSANIELSADHVAPREEFGDAQLTALLVRRFRRERSDNLFEVRVTAQRIPKREQF